MTRLTQSLFDHLPDGRRVDVVTLRNRHGLEVRAMTQGGVILSLAAPDRDGRLDDVVLGYDTLARYLEKGPFFGCLVGRCANRIAFGRFTLDGREYQLATNSGVHHLHGGTRGWDKALWSAVTFEHSDAAGLTLTYTSADGEEHYPGTVVADVAYTLNDRNELAIDYSATTDAPTIVNLTQHSYFNLAGRAADDILAHELTVYADAYTPVDAGLIPTGEIASVTGTPLDFRVPTPIGARIDDPHEQMVLGEGYDHNLVVRRADTALAPVAHLRDPLSGRTLDVETTEPGVQFYTANHLGSIVGKGGRHYSRRAAVCFETQHYPDAPNHPSFPSIVLRPGQEFRSRTVFRFGVDR